jgi:molybdopterin-guanine dinucleotide biosynthesis protein A
MSNSNIFILTGPVQTGKTSSLIKWLSHKTNLGGFITEDIGDLRCIKTLSDSKVYPFQKVSKTEVDDILVGKYIFSKDGFAIGKKQLQNTSSNYDWFIVDELGKLEMNDDGFEPELSKCINYFKSHTDQKLLLVIRDFLLDAAIEKYALQQAQILTSNDLKVTGTNKNIKGLVLAGGTSKRMGEDKAFIKYYHKEQAYHIADILSFLGIETFLSINPSQAKHLDTNYLNIVDEYQDCGPLSGIASAFEHDSVCSWIVIGCDYPLLQPWDLNHLLFESKQFNTSCVYFDEEEGFYLPTIGVYHPNCTPHLNQSLETGDYSMQRVLKKGNAIRIAPLNLMRFENANTPQERDQIKNKLNERE